jgi:hypothetical protein
VVTGLKDCRARVSRSVAACAAWSGMASRMTEQTYRVTSARQGAATAPHCRQPRPVIRFLPKTKLRKADKGASVDRKRKSLQIQPAPPSLSRRNLHGCASRDADQAMTGDRIERRELRAAGAANRTLRRLGWARPRAPIDHLRFAWTFTIDGCDIKRDVTISRQSVCFGGEISQNGSRRCWLSLGNSSLWISA